MRGAMGFALWCLAASALASTLPPPVARVLQGHGIPEDAVSVVVQAVDSAEPVLAHLPDVPRNPASVMKLVTTWSALEILGPTYRWPTEVYFLGPLDDGKLDGDLLLKGYGDPYLVLEEFWKLLRALRRIGLEEIAGDLVIDDSFFAVNEPAPGEFDGQPFRTYNVLPSALLVNFKAVQFHFFANPADGRVDIVAEPPLANLDIRNRIRLAEGPCRGYQAGISVDVVGDDLAEVVFGGAFPSRCETYRMARTVLRHDTYVLGLFRTLWEELGGRFEGSLRRGVAAAGSEPALTWLSPPLANVVRSINKNSNNVMTRQLLYTLGAEKLGAPGTREKGKHVIEDFLVANGFDTSTLAMDNGAGLSRDARVSAALLVDVLRAAAASPYAPEFLSSLSLGGLDGTTRDRFDGYSAVMHVKTGSLDHVAALAGYVRAASGADYVVAILLNAEDAHRGPGSELEEAVVRWVYREL
ncbi:MAG TPA: D-alanyl-D-alanine carboxypeptidase/D-alanyl-D-alanine-endopeptidase [Gammaproteobacteria bacterium]